MAKKKEKRNKAWEADDRLWMKEWKVRIKEMGICADSARKSSILIAQIADLNDQQVVAAKVVLNKGITEGNRYRRRVGLKPLPKVK